MSLSLTWRISIPLVNMRMQCASQSQLELESQLETMLYLVLTVLTYVIALLPS